MLSKNKIKLIRSLDDKKRRYEAGLFVVEGDKMVEELLDSAFSVECLLATPEWFADHLNTSLKNCKETIVVAPEELRRCSFLKTPQQTLCLVNMPLDDQQPITFNKKLTLLLDTIQDPGNLGTIIRIADWFGISQIICSPDSADIYNPKVIQSTMGAITRTKILYRDLNELLPYIVSQKIPVYGTTLDGTNIYKSVLTPVGCIIMGNESRGINPSLLQYLSHKLFIPFFPPDQQHSESLNVSVATGIICAEFRRQMFHPDNK